MRSAFLIALALASVSTAQASPSGSQHPRVGVLGEVNFQLDSARVPTDTRTNGKLGEIAAWAKDNPDGLVVLDGHADWTGEEPHNVRLSTQRGEAVREKLIAVGVDPDQIVIAAYGEAGPQRPKLADNRRVTVWGTHQNVDAVTDRTLKTGTAVVWSPNLKEKPAQARPVEARQRSRGTPRGY
jgi:outer membrane protein OmpA-like peptidoglycan-associated protein